MDAVSLPEWNVYFNENFWECYRFCDGKKAGKEIIIEKHITWGEISWYIPAIYICEEGITADICAEQNNADIFGRLELNGKILEQTSGCSMYCSDMDAESRWIAEHYALDRNKVWIVYRLHFRWGSQKNLPIQTIKLILEQQPVHFSGLHFHMPVVGQCIEFLHPVTGTAHTLTIQDYNRQELGRQHFQNDTVDYPTHFMCMTYTLSPDISDDRFAVRDYSGGDFPRRKTFEPEGIIGAAMAVIGIPEQSANLHTACSGLYFQPTENIEWHMTFREKLLDDITIELINYYENPEIPVNKIFQITEHHLDNLYVYLDEKNKIYVFFHLLHEYYFLKNQGYRKETAYICYLLSYYLFLALTPPYSAELALVYAQKAVQFDNNLKYIQWLEFVKQGN